MKKAIINFGVLEALDDIDLTPLDFLAAVSVKWPSVYTKIIQFVNTPGGTEVLVEAVSENEDELNDLLSKLSVGEAEDTYDYNFNDSIQTTIAGLYL